jgi:uncharacterized protein with NRDE domain
MCTIAVLHRVHPEFPVIVAANRDEFYDRPASGPAPWPGEPGIIAGRDHSKGGTWMGATRAGFFVGLTNQRTYQPADPARLSRGDVVLRALRAGSRSAAERYLRGLDATRYNPFNLLFGDASGVSVAYARETREIGVFDVGEGVQVLPNDTLNAQNFPKAARAAALIAPHAGQSWPALREALARALADHARPPLASLEQDPPGAPFSWVLTQLLGALCIHTPTYGTRSSTLLALSPHGLAHYLYADGAPCVTPFVSCLS